MAFHFKVRYACSVIVALFTLLSLNCSSGKYAAHLDTPSPDLAATAEKSTVAETVKGFMQARPGGPMEEVEVKVHEVPVDLPLVPADQAPLEEDDLVLGVVDNGQAVAYPIRYLALSEIIDGYVGATPVAATW